MSSNSSVRFATFNASLNRTSEGQLITDLSTPDNAQAQAVAEIIQRNNPDVLLVNEFDFDANGTAAALFQENYLTVSQNGAAPVEYPY
ncbi:MAG: endonuclease/exonuclease/phosphatase family protein, partial [Leptolyngbya sp. SIO1D8]|nr:endonuclease/exonuclease/phosphatase family protein [Leptolyngbya sp. SIO1D8]